MISVRLVQYTGGNAPTFVGRRLSVLLQRRLPTTSRKTASCLSTITTASSTRYASTTPDTKTTTAAADSNNVDKQKITSIRLYRILQRQCRQLERELQQQHRQQQSNELLLLQTPLEPRAAGSSKILDDHGSKHSPQQQQAAVWALFYHWNSYYFDSLDGHDDYEEEGFLQSWYRQHLTSVSVNYLEWATDSSRWTTLANLKNAIRTAFRYVLILPAHLDKNKYIRYQHAWAIRAYRILQEQHKMLQLTSTSQLHDVQVTATSEWIGRSLTGHPHLQQQQEEESEDEDSNNNNNNNNNSNILKYRFAYRIRIENQSLTDTIQLLGRTWYIQEYNHNNEPVAGSEPIHVYAPQTGAVGQLPVLQPGQAFEYVSGAELSTPQGRMKGCFHLAIVSHDTPSAIVGMPVAALEPDDTAAAANHHRFEVPIRPFPLRADHPTPRDYVPSNHHDEGE